MAKTRAVALLEQRKIPFTLHTFEHEPDYPGGFGKETADKLGLDPACVGKTLVVTVGGKLGAAIVPVDAKLDLKAAAQALGGKKAAMAQVPDAERATGYVHGGISPLAMKTRLPLVLDASLAALPAVVVSAGQRGAQLELAPGDLCRLTGAGVAPVAAH